MQGNTGMIYLEAKRKIRCKGCNGSGYNIIEGYEYVCPDCKGLKYSLKKVLIDIETLAEKIGEKLNGK